MDFGIVWVVCLVLMLAIFAQIIYYLMPIQAKLEMNQLCRQYALTCEIQNGLTDNQLIQLEEQLLDNNFTEVQITAPHIGQLGLGESLELVVQANYQYKELSDLLAFLSFDKRMVYKITVYGRKVIN